MKQLKLNDRERAQWCDNDEYLYNMYRRAKNKAAWIKENRAMLDDYINKRLNRAPRS